MSRGLRSLTFSFFMDDNPAMPRTPFFLPVELRTLQELQVTHRLLLFLSAPGNPDRVIRLAFKMLRQCVTEYGLDPDTLLHVGVPELADGMLISYDCCIEFPLPESLDEVKILPGGRYAVLTVEKTPSKIASAIRTFRGDYLPDHGLVPDEEHPVYEFYFKDTLEYCVPIR
jgi:DNA gyrase inhibitor GyrI